MSLFRPTRASPPSKPARLPEHPAYKVTADISRSSSASVPELSGLSRDEIDLLDAVIERAGSSATTFLTVFKAYTDVLRERGLDPHEVLYYGKLLKLGTMRGRSWGDKWNAVKRQFNQGSGGGLANVDYGDDHKGITRNKLPPRPSLQIDDTFTLHSHADESEASSSTVEDNRPPMGLLDTPPAPISDTTDALENGSLIITPIRARKLVPSLRPTPRSWKAEPPESEENYAPSVTPPSYRAATRQARATSKPPSGSLSQSPITEVHTRMPIITPASARKAVAMARERRGSVMNEEDAWNKIRMQRDEAEADEFRKDRLMERCWEVWKQGFQWIITTNQQIGEARDNLILRIHLQRWRTRTASRREIYKQIINLSNTRCLRKLINTWRSRLREKQQNKWRQGMRQKMKIIREIHERKLRKDAWAKWRQSYRWKKRVSAIAELDNIADHAYGANQEKAVVKCWNHWRNAMEMRNSERTMSDRIALRLMGEAMSAWYKNMHDRMTATEFYNLVLMRTMIRSWKSSKRRIQTMENRALKHVARQDGVLLRAVSRVWKARERGKLLARVRASRLIKNTWSLWQERLQQQKQNQDLAVAFSLRADSDAVGSALRTWRDVYATHQNAHSFAMQYDSAQLRYKMLLKWRIQLREKLKLIKMARMADKFFATRCAWRTWHDALKARAREKRVEEFKKHGLERIFRSWFHRAQQQKQRGTAEQVIKDLVNQRILKEALRVWTNRVIEIKLRELEVTQESNLVIQTLALKRWHAAYARHAEELSLMENYLMVKRDEHMRRLFNRWLTHTRITRHRRITLKQKEDEMKLNMLGTAWDKWRDRFSDEKLRPIEHTVVIQTQRNALFRSFGLWHAKTKSLPAIRFHANNVKIKHFEIWRQAMPRALQAKKAREMDKKHRSVPTVPPGPSPGVFPRPPVQRPLYGKEQPSPSDRFKTRPSAVSLLRTNTIPAVEKSPGPRFLTRAPSPVRSKGSSVDRAPIPVRDVSPSRPAPSTTSDIVKGEGTRSRLWLELRDVQRRPRPSSLHSRARDPL
ncbi:hypothetical protein H0H81_001142 [Sphagnurus paluster]|uniref:Sfi1 spindle body domain-containing protein n=1 Tax=Sphagnurus paluster TaxID=117069 RepID=A0A9P7GQT9_9AGAR|nr:hypothetical protein H0H81_001142 [Sphagnurus paluster]